MLNQVAVEALYSASYVENYLDAVENLPDDVQRNLSRIRDIDVQYRGHLRDVDYYYEQWNNCSNAENSSTKRARFMSRLQQNLIAAQELGDEKLQILSQLQDIIDHKTRKLDLNLTHLDYGKEEQLQDGSSMKMIRPPSPIQLPSNNMKMSATESIGAFSSSVQPTRVNTPTNQSIEKSSNSNSNSERPNKRSRRPRNDITIDMSGSDINSTNDSQQKQGGSNHSSGGGGGGGVGGVGSGGASQKKSTNSNATKKKKRKTRGSGQSSVRDTHDDTPPPEETIDPDEPTYCICDQISYGEMILCDNDLCPIEWFHFSCVFLSSKPKGKWFCPNCRGDRSNIMKPKAQFLKELERYNKEKEEKT